MRIRTEMDKNSVSQIAQKALRNSFYVGIPILIACSFVDFSFALGFIVGFFIGIANLFMLYSSVIKGIMLSPDKAKRHMMISYPLRFLSDYVSYGLYGLERGNESSDAPCWFYCYPDDHDRYDHIYVKGRGRFV